MSVQASRILGAMFVVLLLCSAHSEAACTISTTSVNFGTYNVYSATPLDSTGTVTFRCGPPDRNIVITLSRGSSATFNPRTLRMGAEVLNYNLYRNAARTNIWGDGTGGTAVYSDVNPPNNTNVVLTVYARIPAGQDVSGGNYNDTIVDDQLLTGRSQADG